MSKLIFTAEMFKSVNGFGSISPINHAKNAQAIHDKYMASGTVVYSTGGFDSSYGWFDEKFEGYKYTHQAILLDIKEIEKVEPECAHGEVDRVPGHVIYKCGACHKQVKPTGWKLAEGDGE